MDTRQTAIHGQLELRLARKLSANGSAEARAYLSQRGMRDLDGPESHEVAVGAAWQFFLARAFGMLSSDFADLAIVALRECLDDDGELVERLEAADPLLLDADEEDQELDFRGFVALDEDFVSDSGVQMLAALLGSREPISLRSQEPFGRIEVHVLSTSESVSSVGAGFSRRGLIESAGVLKRFPDEVYRLALLSQAVHGYIQSCRTELAREAALSRFHEVITAAAELHDAAEAIGNARVLIQTEDPSAPLSR
jgi:hypothetical protein